MLSGGTPPEGLVKQPILIVTAHMHWDPEFSDVKLIQTMMLMSELKRIVEESYHTVRPSVPAAVTPDCNIIPMILCGDLNSLPESGLSFTHKAPPIICSRRQFQILPLFSKITNKA